MSKAIIETSSGGTPSPRGPSLASTFVALFVAAIVILFLMRTANVLILVFVAVLIGVYLSAVTDVLEQRLRLWRWAGLTIAVIGTSGVLTGVGWLLLPPVIDQTQALIGGLPATLADIQAVLARWASQYPWLRGTRIADPQSGIVTDLLLDTSQFLRGSLLPYVRVGGELLIETVAVLVMAAYLASSPTVYRDGIVSLVAPRFRAVARRILDDASATLRAWAIGQLLAMAVLALFTAIGLWILGLEYWLAFGIFTGLVAVVPFFGTLVSTVLPAIFVVGSGNWLQVFAVLMLGVVVHLVEANLVVPRIMQRQIALPPVLTIASVLLMGTLVGPVGLIVAVPTLALALVLVRHILLGEIYGDPTHLRPAVLRPTDAQEPSPPARPASL